MAQFTKETLMKVLKELDRHFAPKTCWIIVYSVTNWDNDIFPFLRDLPGELRRIQNDEVIVEIDARVLIFKLSTAPSKVEWETLIPLRQLKIELFEQEHRLKPTIGTKVQVFDNKGNVTGGIISKVLSMKVGDEEIDLTDKPFYLDDSQWKAHPPKFDL